MRRIHDVSGAKKISRRGLLQLASVSSLAFSPATMGSSVGNPYLSAGGTSRFPEPQLRPASVREFLSNLIPTREEVETFLNHRQPNWARFDPELGYTLQDNILKDGVGGSRTITSYQKTGERTTINYAHRPCRINTYGDSFTQCHQASDGETWQEYLAAHLGEPLRNFGIGGYGTYQAYRRMLREEATPRAADFVILNIWDLDDYLRSIDAWRWLRIAPWFRASYLGHLYMFHANPWVHVRLDLETGDLVEKENHFNTPESLRNLSNLDYVYEQFKDDLVVKLLAAQAGVADTNWDDLKSLAAMLNVKTDFSSADAAAATARAVHVEYALRAGIKVIEKAHAFAEANKKKLMVLLSFGEHTVADACEGQPRFDQRVLEFLKKKNLPFVDSLAGHLEDFQSFRIAPQAYVKRYYIGHYNPRGNHFFAFVIKDSVVRWLEPKPLAYRDGAETIPAVV
jgi:hypothetical protein